MHTDADQEGGGAVNRPEEPLNDAELEEFNELMGALREGTITDQQTARLDQIVAENPAAMEMFCQMIQLIAELHSRLGLRVNATQKNAAHVLFAWIPRTWGLGLAASLALILTASAALWVEAKKNEAAQLKRWETSELLLSQYPLSHAAREFRASATIRQSVVQFGGKQPHQFKSQGLRLRLVAGTLARKRCR